MVSISTNLSSILVQSALTNSTNGLNKALERMSTGYKINHASDNAANYSISTNLDTKISAYDVAASNVAMGMDLVTVAQDIISEMQSHASRLHDLCIQSRSGTYGAKSISALQNEANARISEIARLYTTCEYNGISLLSKTVSDAISSSYSGALFKSSVAQWTVSSTSPNITKAPM